MTLNRFDYIYYVGTWLPRLLRDPYSLFSTLAMLAAKFAEKYSQSALSWHWSLLLCNGEPGKGLAQNLMSRKRRIRRVQSDCTLLESTPRQNLNHQLAVQTWHIDLFSRREKRIRRPTFDAQSTTLGLPSSLTERNCGKLVFNAISVRQVVKFVLRIPVRFWLVSEPQSKNLPVERLLRWGATPAETQFHDATDYHTYHLGNKSSKYNDRVTKALQIGQTASRYKWRRKLSTHSIRLR